MMEAPGSEPGWKARFASFSHLAAIPVVKVFGAVTAVLVRQPHLAEARPAQVAQPNKSIGLHEADEASQV